MINKTNNPPRDVDRLTKEISSWQKKEMVLVAKTKIATWKGILFLAFVAGIVATIIWTVSIDIQTLTRADYSPSPLMSTIKTKGCIADGILSEYGNDTSNLITVIKRSQCQYLHRALETWTAPPDFSKAKEIMKKIDKPDIIYGMFLAEALNPQAQYGYGKNKKFDFSKMCQKNSLGFWGPGTCKADLKSKEYRKYLEHITREAIDLGIQSFLFGQIHFQERDMKNPEAPKIVSEMRKYAASKGKTIVIGAQTNTITDEKYLRVFDYIEGGVGENSQGEIENSECSSKWNWCWALLWHPKYASKANDVLLHLDWSGLENDDMSIFAQMDQSGRKKTLTNLYQFFTSKNMGFLMPVLAVINENITGCQGPRKNFYSSGNMYSCQDEEIINNILSSAKEKNYAAFVSQNVPSTMETGQKYAVTIVMKNSGTTSWTKEKKYRLGNTDTQNESLWGGRINLEDIETIKPKENKIFTFDVTAPRIPGQYIFQWRMVEENAEWFGEMTPAVNITVTAAPEKPAEKVIPPQPNNVTKPTNTGINPIQPPINR